MDDNSFLHMAPTPDFARPFLTESTLTIFCEMFHDFFKKNLPLGASKNYVDKQGGYISLDI